MKAVLVQPPIFWTTTPPLGPAYLAGELLASGDDVRLFDFNIELFAGNPDAYATLRVLTDQFGHLSPRRRLTSSEVALSLRSSHPRECGVLEALAKVWAARVLDEHPDLIGISIHEESLLAALFLARELRETGSPGPLVAGGPEAIFIQRSRHWLNEGLFDAVVAGEGEGPFREIARRVRSGAACSLGGAPIPGAVVVASGEIFDAADAGSLVDIQSIATPSFAGLPLEAYSFPDTLPIVFSRGCPAKCTFCFETVMWQRFRLRSVESVIEEIQLRLRTYGPSLSFRFNDSLLNGDMAWLERFADAVLESGLEFKWHGNARIHPGMTPRLLEKLAAAGLTGLLYGVESGSQKILQRMKKGVHAPVIPRVIADTHQAGIWTHAFLILDFPGEGDAELLETLGLVEDQLENLDSMVFHDFHLPPELVDYVNFTGRVPVDETGVEAHDPALLYQSNAAALRPFVDVFLENFLQFAHAHGNVHSMRIGPLRAQGLLYLYRERWRRSPEFARARLTMRAFRALVIELAERGLTVLIADADESLPQLRGRRILKPQSDEPRERRLAALAYARRPSLRRAVEVVQRECSSRDRLPAGEELLDLLADALTPAEPETEARERAVALPVSVSERLAPEGWR